MKKPKIEVRTKDGVSQVRVTFTSSWFNEKAICGYVIGIPFDLTCEMRRAVKQETTRYETSPERMKALRESKARRLKALQKAQSELLKRQKSQSLSHSEEKILGKVTTRLAALTPAG